jgi:DUF4097 and DUF4098 domain-containing protein YvlB
MNIRVLSAAIVLLTSGSVFATVSRTFSSDQPLGLAANGTFLLENPVGNIVIVGKDTPGIEATLYKTIDGTDKEAVEEGRRQTKLIIGGDDHVRSARMAIAPGGTKEWTASVAWRVSLPRTANLRVITRAGDHIRVSGMRGMIQIKNYNGRIMLDDVIGAAVIESVNGSIFYTSPQLKGNVLLSTVNGDITATVPRDAGFRWNAETIKGDIRTNLPARGAFFGTTFRGNVNAPGGPTLSTGSLMGTVSLYAEGSPVRTAKSVRQAPPVQGPNMKASTPPKPLVQGSFRFQTSLGDVRIQQILGDADIATGAGEVQLGAVSGSCIVQSGGGPLQFGEILGLLKAATRAGDILVDSARRGGEITTEGGTIRLLYTSGPTRLYSGGGDINVRQAKAPIDAETVSGDISIFIDGTSKTQRVDAKTSKGNVALNVSSQFGADVDATIITSDPNADTIVSDIPGLSLSRDTVNGKTRVRAVGKINGGGEKITLQATDGDIRISTGTVPPTVVTRR